MLTGNAGEALFRESEEKKAAFGTQMRQKSSGDSGTRLLHTAEKAGLIGCSLP